MVIFLLSSASLDENVMTKKRLQLIGFAEGNAKQDDEYNIKIVKKERRRQEFEN